MFVLCHLADCSGCLKSSREYCNPLLTSKDEGVRKGEQEDKAWQGGGQRVESAVDIEYSCCIRCR